MESEKSFNPIKKAKSYWHMLGPGLTTGASDDDPSGIATYSQAGAKYGFQFLWLAVATFPLSAIVQEMCARIGLVTGRGLAGAIRVHYSKVLLYICAGLLFFANSFNIGADLGAMAKSVQLILPNASYPFLIVGFVIISLLLQIFVSYAIYAKYLKYLTFTLFAYVFVAFSVNLDWTTVLRNSFIPSLTFSKDQIIMVCAFLGTTISPYLFFWQTSQEVEEQIQKGATTLTLREDAVTKKEMRSMRFDVWIGMLVSNLAAFFIIAACGAVLFSKGITNINSAADAALALRPLAGDGASLLFAIGVIGIGMLAIPVLAGSASYAITESFGWRYGLHDKFRRAIPFYSIIILSSVLGIAMNFLNIDPIKALIYAAVINGLIAPFILIFIVKLSSDSKVMGENVNRPIVSYLGWLTVILMGISGVAAIWALL